MVGLIVLEIWIILELVESIKSHTMDMCKFKKDIMRDILLNRNRRIEIGIIKECVNRDGINSPHLLTKILSENDIQEIINLNAKYEECLRDHNQIEKIKKYVSTIMRLSNVLFDVVVNNQNNWFKK